MIARLRGTIQRLSTGNAIVDVRGVGYMVSTPINTWENITDGDDCTLWISTYVREDRLELYGFVDQGSCTLFELLIAQSGIGPKMGLELCAVPRDLLLQAVDKNDPGLLSTVKGIGKKKAEKLLVELRTVVEKQPIIFGTNTGKTASSKQYDEDAISALTCLGYDTPTILQVLRELPKDLGTTEERVTEALRSL